MSPEKVEYLFNKYPLLYRHPLPIECNNGWFDLIDELSSKLENLIEIEEDKFKSNEQELFEHRLCYAIQVKEKYGTLRFYMSLLTDAMDDFIEEASKKSASICEICGEKGKIKKNGWVEVRCGNCK